MRVVALVCHAVAVCLVLVLVGCEPIAPPSAKPDFRQRKIRVVTTIGHITEAARRIGGERVEVFPLMGPGVDPHSYRATPADMTALESADLVLYCGHHLEGAMATLFEQMAKRSTPVCVAVGEAVPPDRLRSATADMGGPHDPHVWFDVLLWKVAVERVRDTLCQMDGGSADQYRTNTARYVEELDAAHAYVKQAATAIPATQRVLITAHDAFYYFGAQYGFEVHGIQGISTTSEAGVRRLQELADMIATRKIHAIFAETSVSRQTVEALQKAVEARGFKVAIGGELFSDALGDAGTPGETYAGMLRHNIDTIRQALVPQR